MNFLTIISLFLISIFFSNNIFADQTISLQLDTNLENVKLIPIPNECIGNLSILIPRITSYLKINKWKNPFDVCAIKNKILTYTLNIDNIDVSQFYIIVSTKNPLIQQNTIEIYPLGFSTTGKYQIISQVFPRYTVNSQDKIFIHVQKNADTWQRDESEYIHNIPLNKIVMHGSHDSGSYAISKNSFLTPDLVSPWIKTAKDLHLLSTLTGWSKTQDFNILTQLNLGIRYLDLRLCGSKYGQNPGTLGRNIYTCHALAGASLKEIIEQTKTFINLPEHEKEIIILDMNHLKSISKEQIDLITNDLIEAFGNKIASPQIFSSQSLIQDFWDQKKQIIVSMVPNNEFFLDEDKYYAYLQYPDIYWSYESLESPWPNKSNVSSLLNEMHINLSTRSNNLFFILQSQETPSLSIVKKSFFFPHLYPNNLKDFTGTYQFDVLDWFYKNKNMINEYGPIILRDFVFGR